MNNKTREPNLPEGVQIQEYMGKGAAPKAYKMYFVTLENGDTWYVEVRPSGTGHKWLARLHEREYRSDHAYASERYALNAAVGHIEKVEGGPLS